MKVIYKYPLEIRDNQTIAMPGGAQILSIQVQDIKDIYIWALVDDEAREEDRHFRIFGTGVELDLEDVASRHVGTVQTHSGGFVWHVFELIILK